MHSRLLALPLVIAVTACAEMPLTETVQVPDKITAPTDESLAMIVAAKGVQIYECRAGKETGTAEWQFVAPEADLFDASGRKVGKHYAGPRWESLDGSTIAGTVKERTEATRANAIPWLLLSAKSVGPEGSFSKVTSVQRVNTVAGGAPDTGCSLASVGQIARMPYTADYYFLARSPLRAAPSYREPRANGY